MRLRTARLRTALRRRPERGRPGRGFTPVEQVLCAPVRPLLQHVHQHRSSMTLQLRVAVGVRAASGSHPIRMAAVTQPPARGPVAAAAAYPGVVFRDRVPPTAAVAAAVGGQPAWPPVPLMHTVSSPASPARAASAARAGRGALPPVELVHRLPAPSASGAATYRPADARTDGTAARAGTRWAGPGASAAPGGTPLTAADVPGVVDQVVREIDRRVVAARERRGWTA